MDEFCSRHENTSPDPRSGIGKASSLPLRDALRQLAACADQLATGDPAQPNREDVARYLDALDRGIGCCVGRLELGRWLDVLCPLKENLHSLRPYAESVEARVDAALVTAAVVLTHLTVSLDQQPTEPLVCELLLDVMAARAWSWPLPAAARPALRAEFDHPASPPDASAAQLASDSSRPRLSRRGEHALQ